MCIQNMKVLLDKQKSMVSGCALCIEKMPGKHSAQTGKMTSFKVWSMVIHQFRFLKGFNFVKFIFFPGMIFNIVSVLFFWMDRSHLK